MWVGESYIVLPHESIIVHYDCTSNFEAFGNFEKMVTKMKVQFEKVTHLWQSQQ